MGTFLFQWPDKTGEIDRVVLDYSTNEWKSTTMTRVGTKFVKYIQFPAIEKVHYRFWIVKTTLNGGYWGTDPDELEELNSQGTCNNILTPERIVHHPCWTPKITGSFSSINHVKPEYPYRPLDFDSYEIRLLRLGWPSLDGDDISCTLEHASLIDPGPYIALSYCWGDPNLTKGILLDSYDIKVTVNLDSALRAVRRLRRKAGDRAVTRLWVDAICINQRDGQERSHQVQNMRQIYSRAEEVLAWVGPVGETLVSNETAARLAIIGGSKDWISSSISPESLRQNRGQKPTNPKIQALQKWSKHDFLAMDTFFSQPYWKRVWVIQEITVGSKVTVLYGELEFLWDDVAAFFSMLKETESTLEPQGASFLGAEHLLEFRERFYVNRSPISLHEALELSRKTLATDPRDKIFALLGLCHDGSTFVPVPNYKQSLESIIADMSRAMMILNKSLDLICLKGYNSIEEVSDIPTWVPSWSSLWTGSSTTIQEELLIKNLTTCSFNPILPSSTNRILKIRGTRVGAVTNISSAMKPHDREEVPQSRPPWIASTQWLRFDIPDLKTPSPDVAAFFNIIWKTLTMSLLPQALAPHAGSSFELLWQPLGRGSVQNISLIEWIDRNAWFTIGRWTLREWSQVMPPPIETPTSSFPSTLRRWIPPAIDNVASSWTSSVDFKPSTRPPPSDREKCFEKFISILERVLGSGMRLACLDTRAYFIAMVHPNTREGDKVFYLKGCSIPVVLRRTSDPDNCHYKVIGGAYIDGSQEWAAEAALTEELILC